MPDEPKPPTQPTPPIPQQSDAANAGTDSELGHPWHALSVADTRALIKAPGEGGLTQTEANARLTVYGPNRLRAEHHESLWETILEEVREPMILLLLATGVVYAIVGGLADALVIIGIIVIVIAVEVFNERRAEQALAALSRMAEPQALVVRDGTAREIPAEEVVPGDVLVLQEGQRVPADARLIEGFGLWADESALTGESVPVEKQYDTTLPEETPLAERANLVFSGTSINRGRGLGLVVATGMGTEIGRVAELAAGVRQPRTPLQVSMRELTRWMVWLALGFSVIIPFLSWLLTHQPLQQMLLTALSLAFATIPEELPILITIVLALGAYRLSRQHAIVKRLRAAETLSAVTVIATDKTGTLTVNHMALARILPEASREKALQVGILSNDAVVSGDAFAGDPLDVALLEGGRAAGIDVAAMRRDFPLLEEFPFDAEHKRMEVVVAHGEDRLVAVKGAPELVLALCALHLVGNDTPGEPPRAEELTNSTRAELLAESERLTANGLRVIALGAKTLPASAATAGQLTREQVESDLTFVAFAGLADPPRLEVAAAIADSQQAGIRVVMVTGDHPLTALAIAREVGIITDGDDQRVMTGRELDALPDEALGDAIKDARVFARTTPEHKLRIVEALRARGERVAVTGDGINDAPALAAADIGIAMGETGTDVAREAADIVLADDNFATITLAVKEGRLLFANLQKAIRFYLAVKVALISVTLLPVLLLVPVPFTPVQIILTELFMDVAASATFVSEPAEDDLMRRSPRNPRGHFMNRAMVSSIFAAAAGLFIAVAVIYLVLWFGGTGLAQARTAAFVTWLLGHVFLALNLRSEREPLFRLGVFSNRLMIVWILVTFAFTAFIALAPVVAPAVAAPFGFVSLTGSEWLFAVALAIIGTFWLEIAKLVFRFRTSSAKSA
jgi:P-type Ca2+ transporter type 2C